MNGWKSKEYSRGRGREKINTWEWRWGSMKAFRQSSSLFCLSMDVTLAPSLLTLKTVLKNIVTHRLNRQNKKVKRMNNITKFILLSFNFQVLTKYLEQYLPHICRILINICWMNESMDKSFFKNSAHYTFEPVGKKSDTERQILHDIIYMWNLKVEFLKMESIMVVNKGQKGVRKMGRLIKVYKVLVI